MDGHILSSNGHQSAQTANSLDRYFATPAIWHPGMDDATWQEELRKMIARSRLAHDFVSGLISPDDFMDGLHDNGVDVHHTVDGWDEGIVYL